MKPAMIPLASAALFAAAVAYAATEAEELVQEYGLTHYALPEYPENLRAEGVMEGEVTLAVSRDAGGDVGDILVLESTDPSFTREAIAAVRQWRFLPARADVLPPEEAVKLVKFHFKVKGLVITYEMSRELGEHTAKASHPRERVSVRSSDQIEVPPKPVRQRMPEFPAELRGRVANGSAKVMFYVDESGRVRLPVIVEATQPEFGRAAVAAVTDWRYEPPRHRGRTVVSVENWRFQFGPEPNG